MNCENLRIRSKNYEKYFYCVKNKCIVDANACSCCNTKTYKEYKPINKVSRKKKIHRKSILQNRRECFVTGQEYNLDEHHVFGGKNRHKSELWGLKIYLTPYWHNMSDKGIHFNKKLDIEIKKYAQKEFEKRYGREKFIQEFGENYLDD